MPRKWTDEQRAAQAERCRANRPWEHSTGPRTTEGKRKVSQNGCKAADWDMWFSAWLACDSRRVGVIRCRLARREATKARWKS